MKAKECFDAGDLAAAIAAATHEVKTRPTDFASHTLLFELLCFAGELDRAQRQLETLAALSPQSDWGTQVYINLLEAERKRRRLFAEGGRPEFFVDPPAYIELHLQAISHLRAGRAAEALELLDRSDEVRPEIVGQIPDGPIGPLCDGDDVLAPVLEFMALRDYLWVPWEQIRELEILPPQRLRDLVWSPGRVELRDGSQHRGYVPALYNGTHEHENVQVRLGRLTDWRTLNNGPVKGAGQHTIFVGEDCFGLLEIRLLRIELSAAT